MLVSSGPQYIERARRPCNFNGQTGGTPFQQSTHPPFFTLSPSLWPLSNLGMFPSRVVLVSCAKIIWASRYKVSITCVTSCSGVSSRLEEASALWKSKCCVPLATVFEACLSFCLLYSYPARMQWGNTPNQEARPFPHILLFVGTRNVMHGGRACMYVFSIFHR